jgi:hypothetical protein
LLFLLFLLRFYLLVLLRAFAFRSLLVLCYHVPVTRVSWRVSGFSTLSSLLLFFLSGLSSDWSSDACLSFLLTLGAFHIRINALCYFLMNGYGHGGTQSC